MLVIGLIALAILAVGVIVLVINISSKRMTADNAQVYSTMTEQAEPSTLPPPPPPAAVIDDEALAAKPLPQPADMLTAIDDAVDATNADTEKASSPTAPSATTGDPSTSAPTTDKADAAAIVDPTEHITGPIFATPGPDTTRQLEPLNADGSFNFVAALDQGYGNEIEAQRNAAILLLQILPTPGRASIRDAIYQRLQITGPPASQGFVRPRAFLESESPTTSNEPTTTAANQAQSNTDEDEDTPTEAEKQFMELLQTLARKPWAESEHPQVARWLELNRQALEDIAAAVERKRFYVPMVSGREPEVLPKVSLPYLTPMREAGRALAARATLRLSSGYVEGSIQDVLVIYRMGRLLRQPPILLCQFTGNALETLANETTSVLADHPALTSAHARLMIEQMRKLPGWPVAERTASMGERYMFLDAIQVAQRNPVWGNVSEALFLRDPSRLTGTPPTGDLPMVVNFATVMTTVQNVFDQAERALARVDFPAASRALEAIDRELKPANDAQLARAFDPAFIAQYQAAGDAEKRRMMTPVVSALATRSIVPLMATRLRNEYMLRMKTGFGEISLALSGYQRDTGNFPQRLEELSPQYLRPIPRDVFVDRSLYFTKQRDGSIIVYSVGPNLNDDGGNAAGNRDIVLRMNVPVK